MARNSRLIIPTATVNRKKQAKLKDWDFPVFLYCGIPQPRPNMFSMLTANSLPISQRPFQQR